MKKKIIVFGATGHLGAYTIDYLNEVIDKKEYEIIATGRRETSFFDRYNIKYCRVNILDRTSFDSLPKKNVYAVVALCGAMPAATEGYNPYNYVEVNIKGIIYKLPIIKRFFDVNDSRLDNYNNYDDSNDDIWNHIFTNICSEIEVNNRNNIISPLLKGEIIMHNA